MQLSYAAGDIRNLFDPKRIHLISHFQNKTQKMNKAFAYSLCI